MDSDPTVNYEELESAYTKRIQTYSINNCGHINLIEFLQDAFSSVFESKQSMLLQQHHFMKTYGLFAAEFKKSVINSETQAEEEIRQMLYVHGGAHLIDIETDLQQWFNTHVADVVHTRIEEFEIRGSGWTLVQICQLLIYNNKYEPIRGSSYMELPSFIRNKKAIVNVKNMFDKMCFKWAILSAQYPVRNHVDRLSNYTPYADTLDFSGISFPVHLNQIERFEQLNPTISVNVYTCNEQKKVIPVRLTKNVKQLHVHLFLLQKPLSTAAKSPVME